MLTRNQFLALSRILFVKPCKCTTGRVKINQVTEVLYCFPRFSLHTLSLNDRHFCGLEQDKECFSLQRWPSFAKICTVANYSKHFKWVCCGHWEPRQTSDVRFSYMSLFIHSYGFWHPHPEGDWRVCPRSLGFGRGPTKLFTRVTWRVPESNLLKK